MKYSMQKIKINIFIAVKFHNLVNSSLGLKIIWSNLVIMFPVLYQI